MQSGAYLHCLGIAIIAAIDAVVAPQMPLPGASLRLLMLEIMLQSWY